MRRELDVGEFRCVKCEAISLEHGMDGLGECIDCAESAVGDQEQLELPPEFLTGWRK